MGETRENRILRQSKPRAVDVKATPIGSMGGSPMILPNHSGVSHSRELTPILPPIGAGMMWFKSLTNTPALPEGWVECNGQVLSDPSSIYHGVTIPNLNGASGGTKRFLRGSTTSGTTGGADSHTHAGVTETANVEMTFGQGESAADLTDSQHTHNFTTDAASSLPSYYEVVWIVRVK